MEIRVKTGLEIVRLHAEYRQRIGEVEEAITTLEGHDYTQSVLEEQLGRLRADLQTLESTRFEALEPVIIGVSLLGGK